MLKGVKILYIYIASKKDLELEKAKKIYDKFMEEQSAEDEREEEEYFKLVKSNMDKLQLEHELRYKKLKAEEELTHMLLHLFSFKMPILYNIIKLI
jgi:hypothetical protein